MFEYKNKSGIYKIECKKTGAFYIGSAVSIYDRWHGHLSELKKGKHGNIHLQRIYNKYGKDQLSFSVIELCDVPQLLIKEQGYINKLNPTINICRVAGNTLGRKHSEETKAYLKSIRKGKSTAHLMGLNNTPEARKKISEAHKKRGLHPAFLAASKKANTGRKHTKEMRNAIALIQTKISPNQAIEIKHAIACGEHQHVLAKKYNVSQRTISRVKQGLGI